MSDFEHIENNVSFFQPFVLHVDVASQMWLVVAADDESHHTTAPAELWRDVIEEVGEGVVRFALVELERNI